jgi:hypothetical protein
MFLRLPTIIAINATAIKRPADITAPSVNFKSEAEGSTLVATPSSGALLEVATAKITTTAKIATAIRVDF